MKFLKWFSLFFMSMCITMLVGIGIGFQLKGYFYPGNEADKQGIYLQTEDSGDSMVFIQNDVVQEEEPQVLAVSSSEERVDADTIYILYERDLLTGDEVETSLRLPQMYLGMNREQFVMSMEDYEANPPLSELERGFVNLEVLSFSPAKVEVRMNYNYVKPSSSFFVVVYDGKVVVLLEDRETVYLQTQIEVLDLPQGIQQDIIQGLFVPNEESLYGFLENYTS